MKAILLAAGYATRLHPLTRERAKPLLEIGGRPLLSHLLDRVMALDGLSEIAVVSNRKFYQQFEEWAAGLSLPVPLRLLDDGSLTNDDRLGAIRDLGFALDEIGDASELLVVAGDNLVLFDLQPYLEAFRKRGRPLILVRHAGAGSQGRYNEVELDDDGTVVRFREKPPDPRSSSVAICLYFFLPGVKTYVDRYLDGGGNPDAPGHFIEWLVRQTEVGAMPIRGPWFDIGSLETLEAARAALAGSDRGAGSKERASSE